MANQPNQELYRLAAYLHENFCQLSHWNDCSWLHEKDDWTQFAHQKALRKAKALLVDCGDTIYQLLQRQAPPENKDHPNALQNE